MKITDVRGRVIEMPYPRPFIPSWAPEGAHRAMSAVIVEVETDAGVVGVAGGDMGHGTGPMLLEALKGWIRPQLVGLDAFATTHVANRLRYVAEYVFPRPWVVGVAVWDAVGKACGQPLYKLWGGHAGSVRAYASFGEVRDPAQRAEDAVRVAEEGFRGIKLRVHSATIAEDVAQVAAVREAVGPDVAIMVDANQAASRWRYAPRRQQAHLGLRPGARHRQGAGRARRGVAGGAAAAARLPGAVRADRRLAHPDRGLRAQPGHRPARTDAGGRLLRHLPARRQ
ncbi:hypothetical protein GCM10020001_087840 [Nonomuraea salmonea]